MCISSYIGNHKRKSLCSTMFEKARDVVPVLRRRTDHHSRFPFIDNTFIWRRLRANLRVNCGCTKSTCSCSYDNMGRTSAVKSKDAIAAIKQLKHYFISDPLPPWSHKAWKEMASLLNMKWSFQACQLNVAKDKNNILSDARRELGIIAAPNEKPNNANVSITSEEDVDPQSSSDSASEIDDNEQMTHAFDLFINEKQWKDISTVSDTGLKLTPRVWTNVVPELFFTKFRLPCAFVFKRGKIRSALYGGVHSIKIFGRCKSINCGNTLKGIAEKHDEDDGLIMRIVTRDTRGETHELVKRPLNGQRRKEVQRELKEKGSSVWRKNYARENMRHREAESPMLPSGDVCRQARQEGINADLGVKKEDARDLIRKIEEMNLEPAFTDCIHEVGSLKFHAIYGTPEQLYAYKEYCRLNQNPTIVIDATGSIVAKLLRNGKPSGHIFLYAIVINFEGTTIAIHQMLSEKHTTEFIAYWLSLWQRNCKRIPRQVVCDYSRALLCAISLAFNNQTLKCYISRMFSAISNGSAKQPSTLLRVDVAHFIKAACRWKCWKSVRQGAIKGFFIHCIALMVECTTLIEFEEIFYLTTVVALQSHEDVTILHSELHTTKDARKKLEDYIAVRGIHVMDLQSDSENDRKFQSKEDPFNDAVNEEGNDEDESIDEWVNKIVANAGRVRTAGTELNPFYLPEFVKLLSTRAKEFVLWTNVGLAVGPGHATSSYVEGYFNDLKSRVLKNTSLPMRVDKFLITHLRDIGGATMLFESNMKIANNRRHESNIETKSIEDVVNIEDVSDYVEVPENNYRSAYDSDLFETENWRGKAKVMPEDISVIQEESRLEVSLDEPLQSDSSLVVKKLQQEETDSAMNEMTNLSNVSGSDKNVSLDHSYCAAEISDSSARNSCNVEHDSKFVVSQTSTNETGKSKRTLNEKSTFKTKASAPIEYSKKTSLYFRPYPEIRQKNALMQKNGEPTLLLNGSRCQPIQIQEKRGERKAYSIKNTCAFDSLAHILMTAGIDSVEYFDFLKESKNPTLQFVSHLIQKGSKAPDLCHERGIILKNLYSCKPQMETQNRVITYVVDATDGVATLAKKTLASDPSMKITENCTQCKGRVYDTTLLSPNFVQICKNGFACLEYVLDIISPIFNVLCRQSCKGHYTWVRDLHNHIIIELDIRSSIDSGGRSVTCSLQDMPAEMCFQQGEDTYFKYKLAGIIAHNNEHFVSHCLRASGAWETYDDLANCITGEPKTSINPQLAVYIRCERLTGPFQLGFDVFNALDLMGNKEFLEPLKFGIGDGYSQYYLYNWRCPSMPPNKIGLVHQ